jgi:hypothetical protein
MSGYKLHIISYSLLILVLLPLLNYLAGFRFSSLTLVTGFSIGVLYSILPDIDARRSKIRQFIALSLFICSILYLLYYDPVMGLISLASAFSLTLSFFVRHRGFFHTLTAAVLFSTPLYIINPWFSLFGFLGFLSHLAVDGKLFCLL